MARTSMARSSLALTMFMSRNFTLVKTTAPASRHTLAKWALLFNRPDWVQAALASARWSLAPHSHRASVMCSGRRQAAARTPLGGRTLEHFSTPGPECDHK